MSEDQISLPYFLVILVIFGLIIRYLFFNNGDAAARPGRSQESLSRSREAAVETIQQMFPQTDRRSILWDLQRNGGSVQVTTDRILAGRLDTPPITFQPPPPPNQAPASSSAGQASARAAAKPVQPDLITRYNLGSKVGADSQDQENDQKGKGWSSNRDERQASLQRRREEMILAARRKMEARIAAEKGTGSITKDD